MMPGLTATARGTLLLLFVGAGSGLPAQDVGLPAPSQLEQVWSALPEGSVEKRLEAAAGLLLGRGYALSPLGEGEGTDPDPRLRLDTFDCTTYVETAVALALAPSAEGVPELLDRLRYAGRAPSFDARLHLPESQWLPAFQAAGLLEEASHVVGGDDTKALEVEVSPELWARRSGALDHALPPEAAPTGVFEVPFVSLDAAVERLSGAREPLLLNVVREPRPGLPLLVTHQALLFPADPGRPRILHASSVHGAVAEVSLPAFVAGQAMARRWPVVGINVQRWTLPATP